MNGYTAKDHHSYTSNGAIPSKSLGCKEDGAMTMDDLESEVRTLSGQFKAFLERDEKRREEERRFIRKLRDSQEHQAAIDADSWQKSQTFISKHGGKVASFLVTAAVAFVTWYGSQLRSEINLEQRANQVDTTIQQNSADIRQLKIESINQTIMIDEGFRRFDKILLKSQGLTEEDVGEFPKSFEDLAKNARKQKDMFEKFGDLPKAPIEKED